MKKCILAFGMAMCLMVSGCSAVSEEVYHQMLDNNYDLSHENYNLKSEVERLTAENSEQQSKIAELESDNADLLAEKETLQQEIERLKKDVSVDKETEQNSELPEDLKSYEVYYAQYGQKWYVYPAVGHCVTYIDENSGSNDKEIITYAYHNIVDLSEKYPSMIMIFEWRNANHEAVGMTSLTNIAGMIYLTDNCIKWDGVYEEYNMHEANIYWVEEFWKANYPCPEV